MTKTNTKTRATNFRLDADMVDNIKRRGYNLGTFANIATARYLKLEQHNRWTATDKWQANWAVPTSGFTGTRRAVNIRMRGDLLDYIMMNGYNRTRVIENAIKRLLLDIDAGDIDDETQELLTKGHRGHQYE